MHSLYTIEEDQISKGEFPPSEFPHGQCSPIKFLPGIFLLGKFLPVKFPYGEFLPILFSKLAYAAKYSNKVKRVIDS